MKRGEMLSDIEKAVEGIGDKITIYQLLGKSVEGLMYTDMISICKIACTYISDMY